MVRTKIQELYIIDDNGISIDRYANFLTNLGYDIDIERIIMQQDKPPTIKVSVYQIDKRGE